MLLLLLLLSSFPLCVSSCFPFRVLPVYYCLPCPSCLPFLCFTCPYIFFLLPPVCLARPACPELVPLLPSRHPPVLLSAPSSTVHKFLPVPTSALSLFSSSLFLCVCARFSVCPSISLVLVCCMCPAATPLLAYWHSHSASPWHSVSLP